jgi:hypothetical protein
MARALAGSIEAVGSSSNSSRGVLSMALASLTRVCSPDDSTPHLLRRTLVRSNSASSASMRAPRPATP